MNKKLLNVAQLMTSTLRMSATSTDVAAILAGTNGVDWNILVHHADGHSLTPLLYDVWRRAEVLQIVPADFRERMARAYADNTARNINIRRELIEIHQILTEADVPHLVLKGWPLVERLYADPAHRVLYDHDFLVPTDRASAGHQALLNRGFRPLPAKDEWVEKHLSPLWRNDGYRWDGYLFDPHYPRPVELHLHLWEQGWRGLQVSQLTQLWSCAQTRTVAGEPIQLLSDEDALIHLAMHFAGHLIEREARLNQLLDLARFIQQASFLDWERIWAQADQANNGRFVYASLYLAQQIFGSRLPPANIWRRLAEVTPPAFRQWLIAQGPTDVLTTDYRRRQTGQDYHLTFLAADSVRERWGIIRFAMLPPLDQLVVKYKLSHVWLGPLLYPRYLAERVGTYGRAWLSRS
jgi:hypothetical protein